MRTGVSYMGHHNPRHMESDLKAMAALGLDDVLLAAQENDFAHFTGKLEFLPRLAKENGIRPIAIFWGALNLFGGGRSSQFLLEHPEGFQVARDGSRRAGGCYVNPVCVARIKEMIGQIADWGFQGYFVDEPTNLVHCFCPACRDRFHAWCGGDLLAADEATALAFRHFCVSSYVRDIANHCRDRHPELETHCCVMPSDRSVWEEVGAVESLASLGTDIYWVNNDRPVEEMRPLVRDMADICRRRGKMHQEWLQCWKVKSGQEGRVLEQGEVLIDEKPDALYVWAWLGQIGTTESCDDPGRAWAMAEQVLRLAKERS